MAEASTLGILVTIFIILNIVSTIIIVSACIVSGRASRAVDPTIESKMISQRELAIAISKLRNVGPELAATNQGSSHSFVFIPAEQNRIDEYPASHPAVETVIAS